MDFVVGYDLSKFKKYYRTLEDLGAFYKKHGLAETERIELQDCERLHVERNPAHLIVWTEQGEIVGHAIWHETSTDEMTQEDPREEDDRQILRHLCGGKRENLVELHEVWLRTEHRGRGFGRQFFAFFEDLVRQAGYDGIVYYNDNPAAISLCRHRGWREGFLERSGWHVFVNEFRKRR